MASGLASRARPRPQAPVVAGVSIAVLGTVLTLATLAFDWLDRNAPPSLPGLSQGWALAVQMLVEGFGLLTLTVVAAVIVWRQPRNRVSWTLGSTAVLLAVAVFSGQYAFHGLFVAPGSLPLAESAARLEVLLGAPVLAGAILLVLLFPDGRLMSPRWRVIAVLTPVLYLVDLIGRFDDPFPLDVGVIGHLLVPVTMPPAGWAAGALVSWTYPWLAWVEVALGITAAGYLVLRLSQSSGDAQLQLKWFTYATAIGALTLLASQANSPLLAGVFDYKTAQAISTWAVLAQVLVGTVLLPGAICVAVLRYRLYDIDIIISRTILYGGLAVFVAATYGVVVGGIGSLLGQRAGASPLLSILAIALAAVLLEPVRSRLQRLANVAVYGRRASPYQVLSDFARGIGRAEPSDVLLPRMARLLREGTGAATADVWVRVGDRLHRAASSQPAVGPARTVGNVDELSGPGIAVRPVFHDGELLGALTLIKPRGEKVNVAEQRLIDDLASHAGLVFSRYRLVEELRESRTRIVAAQDLERRQLQRNLHDGAQQRFVNALLALGLAQANGSDGSRDLLETATHEVKAGLTELRTMARGLHPALLADSGLRGALVALADRVSIITTVHADNDRRYPEPVEVTAYYIVAEALANAAKHSGASAIDVRLGESGGRLRIEIADDGVGGADPTKGSGLVGLQDRASAIGGTLAIESRRGNGTVIRADLPCE